ncbi:MAG: glucosyl-3-phosphoglycerate synthase [Solirubrobacteraceae bacterium]
MGLSSVVVIPAHDEEATIKACLRALAEQTVGRHAFETILVLDACQDATRARAGKAAAELGLAVRMVTGPGHGPGAARRLGMDLAAERLLAAGRPDGLIASTDADSQPAPEWLARQLQHVHAGARAVAGLVELDPDEGTELPVGVRRRRERDAVDRLDRVRELDPAAEHHHFAGASIGITAAAYRHVGGLEPLHALEDAAFATRLHERGVPILRTRDVRVRTSARSRGRASRGLAVDLEVSRWLEHRRFRADEFDPAALLANKAGRTVTVVIPTKECAQTIGAVVGEAVGPLRETGVIDELVVIDAGSRDDTAGAAARAGARVIQQDEVAAELGPAQGKGDAMWRALRATGGEIVCFLDGDTRDPSPGHLVGLLGPILADREIKLIKGAFERPLAAGGQVLANEGGRVTELMARPLINLHEPRLAGFSQPLAGELAAHRSLLEAIPFPVGYGVEIAMLIDALRRDGLAALAECDLGMRQNRHQSLRSLGEMAYAVLAAVQRRCGRPDAVIAGAYLRPWDDGSVAAVPVAERPPIATLSDRRPSRLPVASGDASS